MKYAKIQIFLVFLMIMGSFPGIYAINMVQNDNSKSIDEINNDTDGARTIYVAKNGTDRNNGLTPESPKRNIENALIVANSGDTISVGPGTYQTNLQINKNITLIGNTQNSTIIDGQRLANCIRISAGVTVTITNFIIKNGTNGQLIYGGGIHNEGTLNLEDSTITNCISEYGGGIYNTGTMTVSRVTSEKNNASASGGGIYNTNLLTIEDSTITNNSACWGGGIYNTGTMTVSRVINEKNIAHETAGGIENNGLLTIEDSTITNNAAGSGGGIYNTNILYVYGSTINNNRANNGGGIFNANITRTMAYIDDLTVINNNIPNNFVGKPFVPA